MTSTPSAAALEARVKQLERKLQRTISGFVLTLVLAVAGLWALPMVAASDEEKAGGAADLIRTRGLIVEDNQGRARIILGAPTPTVPERKRQDASAALIFLDENGHDRVAVGYAPDPKGGKRIAQATGIQINDENGQERGGFGYLDNGRIVLGLDYPGGREAITAAVVDADGYAALMFNGEKAYERAGIYVGRDGPNIIKLAGPAGTERVMMMCAGTEDPKLMLLNPEGKPVRDVFQADAAAPAE